MRPIRAVLLSLVVVSSLAAAAGVVAERPISEARMGSGSPSSSQAMKAASNGEGFLVTWYSETRGWQAMALDAEGRPVAETATGLPVSASAVFWREGAWYVVGAGPGNFGWIRVSAGGGVLDPEPHRIEVPSGSFLGAVWTGEALIAAVHLLDRTNPWMSKWLDTRAIVYDANFEQQATYTLSQSGVDISFLTDGGTALLTFRENGDWRTESVRAALFRRDGGLIRQVKIDDVPGILAGGARGDAAGYFFVSKPSTGQQGLLGSFHLAHNLIPRRGPGMFGVGVGAGSSLSSRELAWDGSAYTFFYRSFTTSTELRVARLTQDGTLLEDARVMGIEGNGFDWHADPVAKAGMGTSILLYLRADEPMDGDALVRLRAGHDGTTLAAAPELNLERSAFAQTMPMATSSNGQSLVLWREQASRTELPRIYATRVRNGEVLDPQSLLLGTLANPAHEVIIASDGDGFVAAWPAPGPFVTVRHIAADGAVGPEIAIPHYDPETSTRAVQVLSNGDGYLLVWSEGRGGVDRAYAVHLRGDGTVIDPAPIRLGVTNGSISGASDGSGYFLVWLGHGVLLSSAGTEVARVHTGFNYVQAAWWNGSSYSILVDSLDSHDPVPTRIANIAADGSVTVGTPLPWRWDDSDWAYGSFENCGAAGCSRLRGTVVEGQHLLWEERLTPSGFAAGSSAPVLPARRLGSSDTMRGALLRVPGGRLWAAVERRAPEVPYAGTSRIFLVPLDPSRVRSIRH